MKTLQTAPGDNSLPEAKGKTLFTFGHIFEEDSTTQEVYEGGAQEFVHPVVRGLNGTIFAYGQASSGKTFTILGGNDHDAPEIMQLAAQALFDLIEQASDRMFTVSASYVEIYDKDVKNLLKPGSPKLQVIAVYAIHGLRAVCERVRTGRDLIRCTQVPAQALFIFSTHA